MKGFIQLTMVNKVNEYPPKYEKFGYMRINVKGIEYYASYLIKTITGSQIKVGEDYDEITRLIEEATKED